MNHEANDVALTRRRMEAGEFVYGNMWQLVRAADGYFKVVVNHSLYLVVCVSDLHTAEQIIIAHNRDLLNMLDALADHEGELERLSDYDVIHMLSTQVGKYCWSHLWYLEDPVRPYAPIRNDVEDIIVSCELPSWDAVALVDIHNEALWELLRLATRTDVDRDAKGDERES